MIALTASDHNHVDTVHALALESGATDEGAPERRGKNFYGVISETRMGKNSTSAHHPDQAKTLGPTLREQAIIVVASARKAPRQ